MTDPIAPIFCIGRIGGVLTIQTRRWLCTPTLLARRSRKDNKRQLICYHHAHSGWVLRLGDHRWLTRRGIHGDYQPI